MGGLGGMEGSLQTAECYDTVQSVCDPLFAVVRLLYTLAS